MYCNGSCVSIINEIDNSLHLAPKYARIFVCGHYQFQEANRFPRTTLRKIVLFSEQIMSADKYPSILSKSNLFRNKRSFENRGLEYINNSLHLARKYARIFVRGHYLFREASIREHSTRKTVSFEDQIMSKDKYSSMLLCLLFFKSFSQRAQFCKLGNILGYCPVLAGEYSVASLV